MKEIANFFIFSRVFFFSQTQLLMCKYLGWNVCWIGIQGLCFIGVHTLIAILQLYAEGNKYLFNSHFNWSVSFDYNNERRYV